ncbi:hypothetical protein Dsin_017527 [Dipteronia sinensis]|uniref:Arf-GAP domain-containing protein n=1 Tax=Dipteronia sinensis TaxID=43782 RepID=A0AAE0AFP6_9ROSI|nr:hypothetical protein Dsin_017527 [Dipteronia sinensis]
MSNRLKGDEIIERNIRSLLKLPENRRCINCKSLGPQYVCTTFLTFVCTNCSGVHREFTHRVKSVSMAKFTTEEVSALQAAGNERARQIYLKEWDHQRQSHPDCSNLNKIREFIRHVYVDRKYTGERSDKLPKLRMGEKEEFGESRKVAIYRGESRSPRYESRYEQSSSGIFGPGGRSDDKSSRYYYDERRSPRYAKENSRYSGLRKTPAQFEVVDDRVRDDRFGSSRRSDNLCITYRENKSGSRSPDSQSSRSSSSPLAVRPLKNILGENALQLDVGKIAKAIDGKEADGSANKQNMTPSGSRNSVDGKPVEHKKEPVESLIDFDSNPAAPDTAAAAAETKQITRLNNGGNWSPHETLAEDKAPMAPKPNTLDFLLFELSSPLSIGNNSGNPPTIFSENNMPAGGVSSALPPTQMSLPPASNNASTTVLTTNMPAAGVSPVEPSEQMLTFPSSVGSSITAPINYFAVQQSGGNMVVTGVSTAAPLGQMTADSSSSSTPKQTGIPVGALNNQPWSSSLVPSTHVPSSASAEHTSQTLPKPAAQGTSSAVGSDSLPGETKSTGRTELPMDLFTSSYMPAPAPAPLSRWQSGPPQAMGYNTQYYPNTMLVPAYSNQAKSMNPFDFGGETAPMQGPQFPSMTSLPGDLPNVGLARTSSFDSHSRGLMAPQAPSFSLAISPSPFMGQQAHTNMTPSRLQGVDGFGGDGSYFSSTNTPQQPTSGYVTSTTTNSFTSAGGNPFG